MSMSLNDSAAGNARNALFLARACDWRIMVSQRGQHGFAQSSG